MIRARDRSAHHSLLRTFPMGTQKGKPRAPLQERDGDVGH